MKKTKLLGTCIGILLAMFAGSRNTSNAQGNFVTYLNKSNPKKSLFGGNPRAENEKILVKDAFAFFEKKFKVSFVYEIETVKNKEVSKSVLNNATILNDALKLISDEINLRFKKISDNVVAVYGESKISEQNSATGIAASTNMSLVQTTDGSEKNNGINAFSISGTVTDSRTGKGLSGVTVLVKGTNVGTSTNNNGEYSLQAPQESGILVFSSIGYLATEVPYNKQSRIDLKLSLAVQTSEEVVVIGYGKQKRANLTGAVATIKSKEIEQSPVADLSNSLAGRLPGLITTQRSGEPGSDGANLLIRGLSTNGDNTPLYVIDGIPRQANDFNQLNPSEVESVTILKDAASSAVFGVRGANGVVLVTTKRGKSGKPEFAYTFNYGSQQPTRLPEFLGSYDYAVLYNEAMVNGGKPKLYSEADLQKFKDGSDPDHFPNTDWLGITLKKSAPMMQHNLSVSGGSEKVKYLISGSYLDQDGLYSTANYKRYNVRSNLDIEATPTTQISLDVAGRYEDRNFPGTTIDGLWSSMVRIPPVVVSRYSNGLSGPLASDPYNNANNTGYRKQKQNVVLTRLSLTQKLPFIEGLAIRGILAADKQFTFQKNFIYRPETNEIQPGNTYKNTPAGDPSLFESAYQYQSVTAEGHITYDRVFGKHNVNVIALYTQNITDDNFLNAFRDGFPTKVVDNLFAGSAQNRNNNGNTTRFARQGYVGRFNYAFANRYLLEANFRYDGSDNFAEGNRYGFFPSVSAGWVLSEEKFIADNIKILDFAKLRFSWGKLGNDLIPGSRFLYLSSFNFGNPYGFGTTAVSGLNEGALANPRATWEKATKTDIGLEARFMKGLLSVEFDYFKQQRTDILGTRSAAVPAIIGASLPGENFARIDSRGYEIALGHEKRITKSVSYFIRGNVTYAKSKVIDIAEPSNVNPAIKQTGHPLYQNFGLMAIGLFQNDAEIAGAPSQGNVKPGDIRYADLNKDNKIDANDRTLIGRSNIPEIVYGLSLGTSWKGLDFNILLQGAGRVNQYLSEEAAFAFFNGGKVMTTHLDRWTPDNPGATYPRILTEDNNNRLYSSYWLKDASYLRIKNVEIGYSLPQSLTSKIKSPGIRLYVNGMNLATFSKIKTFDPENSNNRGWFYPQQKVINFGVNVQF